jgi:anti-sigma-K factor RskA
MSDADDRDMLAAEYVLGTLDAAERASVAASLARDMDLARAVRAWEDRLLPLSDAVPEMKPPAAVYDALVARLFGAPGAGEARSRPDEAADLLRRRLRRWQAATAGLGLLAASLLAWIGLRELAPGPGEAARFTAVLQRDAGAPAMVLDIDLAARRLTVRPYLASAPAGRAYELWIIDASLGAPRSLGTLPAGSGAQESLSSYDTGVITGATYAVTVEAPGGSPTGLPTSAPILTGKLVPTRS